MQPVFRVFGRIGDHDDVFALCSCAEIMKGGVLFNVINNEKGESFHHESPCKRKLENHVMVSMIAIVHKNIRGWFGKKIGRKKAAGIA
jgi:hypothetical protein